MPWPAKRKTFGNFEAIAAASREMGAQLAAMPRVVGVESMMWQNDLLLKMAERFAVDAGQAHEMATKYAGAYSPELRFAA